MRIMIDSSSGGRQCVWRCRVLNVSLSGARTFANNVLR